MLKVGYKGSHNSHGLNPKEVLYALSTIQYSTEISTTDDKVFVVVTLCIAKCNCPIIAIIDRKSGLYEKKSAGVNKLVTLYPKRNIKIPKNAKKLIE